MLKLTNTMTMKKTKLTPLTEGQIKIFTCGPSIYQRPHIGNYRTFLYEDVLVRFLEYQDNSVKRVMNLTDIEDKSIEEAHSRGEKMADMTSNAAEYFKKEMAELKTKNPDAIVAASSTIDESAAITRTLIEKGYAYHHKDGVFFDPLKVKEFGKLFGLDMSRWPVKKTRFKRDTYNGNRWNRGDFILWHADKGEHIHFWDSVVGRGRPSWNIQDPAIIYSYLGEQVDINCGGIDNIYRHHDYNIAIMEALTGKEYAQLYLHGEHLIVDGISMSKSRGNILYPDHIYAKGFSSDDLRFFLTSQVHYRNKLNFTWPRMRVCADRLKKIKRVIASLTTKGTDKGEPKSSALQKIIMDFTSRMEDDLNLAAAVDDFEKSLDQLLRDYPGGLPAAEACELKRITERIDTVMCCLL